jgi:hypothetical protein
MRVRFNRLVSMVGVASAVCSPAFVTAQVGEVKVEAEAPIEVKAEAVTAVKAERVMVPARPPGAGDLRIDVDKVLKATLKQLLPGPPVAVAPRAEGMVIRQNINVNNMIQQWTTQFRPILKVEYLFVRVVCNPTKEQRIPIARAGLKALDEAAKKYVDWQNNQNRVVGGRLVERPAIPDTRKFIQDALAAAVKATLSSSQSEWYRAEIEARSAEQKRVAVVNLLAKLDQALILSLEQRDKIKDALSSHWNEPWAQGFQSFNLDDQYLPMLPDPLISTFLNDEQKKVWAGTQKITFNSNGLGFGMNMNNEPLDDAFSDAEALREDPKTNPKPELEPKP